MPPWPLWDSSLLTFRHTKERLDMLRRIVNEDYGIERAKYVSISATWPTWGFYNVNKVPFSSPISCFENTVPRTAEQWNNADELRACLYTIIWFQPLGIFLCLDVWLFLFFLFPRVFCSFYLDYHYCEPLYPHSYNHLKWGRSMCNYSLNNKKKV